MLVPKGMDCRRVKYPCSLRRRKVRRYCYWVRSRAAGYLTLRRNKAELCVLSAAMIVGMLAGCGGMTIPESGSLVLSISQQGMLTAKTLEPSLDMTPEYYDVYGFGPDGASFHHLGVEGNIVEQASLVPGEWTIEVEAYNADSPSTLIGVGSEIVTVIAGGVLSVEVGVYPVVGAGQLRVTVEWPSELLINPTVIGVLTPAGGTAGNIGFVRAFDELSATYESPAMLGPDALPNGYYTLSMTLETDRPDGSGISDIVWGTVEAVRILAGEVTSHTYVLVDDVNRGGLGVDVHLESSVYVYLMLDEVVLTMGDDMTAVAYTDPPGILQYQWYLMGAPLTEETGSTVSLGGELTPGVYWLDVVVGEAISLSSARTVIIVAESNVDAPIAINDVVSPAYADAPITVDVTANDIDPNEDALTVISVADGSGGSVVNNHDGTVTYTPGVDFADSDTFTYTVSDLRHGSDEATVYITVSSNVHIGDGVTIGERVIIGSNTTIEDGATIGDDVDIGESVNVGESVVIGDGVIIGADVKLDERVVLGAGTVVESDVEIKAAVSVGVNSLIGAGSKLKDDVILGDGAQIGADSEMGKDTVAGDNFVMGDHSRVKQDVIIGDDVVLGQDVEVEKQVIINDRVRIDDRTRIKRDGVIGADTVVGADCVLGNSAQIGEGVTIGNDVTIGNNASVPDGATVPDGSTMP
jgi:UDP-3-O-[3-hydroxymyristoyl] glucosamine N-acyltransferase